MKRIPIASVSQPQVDRPIPLYSGGCKEPQADTELMNALREAMTRQADEDERTSV